MRIAECEMNPDFELRISNFGLTILQSEGRVQLSLERSPGYIPTFVHAYGFKSRACLRPLTYMARRVTKEWANCFKTQMVAEPKIPTDFNGSSARQ